MVTKEILKRDNLPPVRLVLKPGQRGTKKLLDQYGEKLMCVRYRYDPITKRRLKTIEITVKESYWKPETYQHVVPDVTVSLKIDVKEYELRQTIKAAGGKWNPIHKVWELPLSTTFELDLEERIVSKEHLEKHL